MIRNGGDHMKLYLIRHGETDWNKVRKMQGQTDIPLNEFGKHLARETAPALAEVPFDLVYTSPLVRAKETAQLVLGSKSCPVIEDDRIMEINFGVYEGLCCSKEGWNIPDPEFEYFFSAPDKFQAPEGGEDFNQFQARIKDFYEELVEQYGDTDKQFLISTHGATLCGFLNYVKKEPLSNFWGKGVHKNCAVTILEVTKEKVEILGENMTYYKDKVDDWR